jgi:hypothetical protein
LHTKIDACLHVSRACAAKDNPRLKEPADNFEVPRSGLKVHDLSAGRHPPAIPLTPQWTGTPHQEALRAGSMTSTVIQMHSYKRCIHTEQLVRRRALDYTRPNDSRSMGHHESPGSLLDINPTFLHPELVSCKVPSSAGPSRFPK